MGPGALLELLELCWQFWMAPVTERVTAAAAAAASVTSTGEGSITSGKFQQASWRQFLMYSLQEFMAFA